ncbi:hypothetical protein KC19_3G225400 [Ceratodon purpureus]|uniref:Endo-beta-1,6-galactanase-like domain-containing protein n=1 Tax=Ceratodon purpureus TaxID=3225 RepID=A0A8T0ILJ2_CERPU|nr:hypothetical protein KC19_3G225400 [Ceratodon purpureus]
MAACQLHTAATRQGDHALWADHSGLGCNGMVCRLPSSLAATVETSCSYRVVPSLTRVGGSHLLKRNVVPRRNNTKVFALKPPQQPVTPETEETEEVGKSEEDKTAKKQVEEEKVIKVERKGLLGQVQNFFAWIGAWPDIPQKEEFIQIPRDPQDIYVIWDGWGTSLCWWANFVGGLPKEDFDYVVDLLFDPRKGLGMNIVRYNIGGGADLTFDTNLRPFGDVPGFKSGPNEPYDWTADKRQRAVLFAAREKGANIFEAFNNSPPHWMTLSGSVTGNWKKGQDNLNPKYYEAFADYLTEVVLKYKEWGLQFDTLAPFNEPCEGWWYIDRNKAAQEGCNFSTKSMDKVIPIVKKSLVKKKLNTALSAFDAWTFNTIRAMRGISEESMQAIDQFNAHTYIFLVNREDDAKRREVNRNVAAKGKKLWMSEYGPLNWNGDEHDAALGVAKHITLDINDLHPSAWCYWQALEAPGSLWGLLHTPLVYGTSPFAVDLKKQYYVLMHFSRWIRQGFKVFSNEGLRDFLVTAVDPLGTTVVVVLTNTSGRNKDVEYDLSVVAPRLRGSRIQVAPFRTSRIENHAELPVLNFEKPILEIRSVAKSVTTLVISPLESDHIELFEKIHN